MESGGVRRRDNPSLPLTVGLTSVHIVTELETEQARVKCNIEKYKEINDTDDYLNVSLERKVQVLNRFVGNLGIALHKCIPSVTCGNFGFLAVTSGYLAPRMISYFVIYPFCRLVFGTLYPAYASYKAVRTKNLKEYVKWMMYWIVFALFTCTETFTDVFLSWFPFYYEVKIVIVLWLLSPATKGSSILYRKFVHPALCRREQEIDEYIAKAKDQGYHTVLNLGTKGVNYATTVIMQTAIKGGGGLVQQLRKSYSLSDLSACEPRDERAADEAGDVLTDTRLVRRPAKSGFATRRSASESSRSPMYFPEVDVDVRGARRVDEPDFSHIKSTEDISSGYSSAENSSSLSRAGGGVGGGVGGGARARRPRTNVTAVKRPPAAEDDDFTEELHEDDSFDYSNMPPLVQLSSPLYLSHTEPPFIYQYVGNQVKILQIIGNYPLNNNFNIRTDNPDIRDQKEDVVKTSLDTQCKSDITNEKTKLNDIDIPINIEIKDNKDDIVSENNNFINQTNSEVTDLDNFIDNNRETKSMEKANTIDDSTLNVIEHINDNLDEGLIGTLASTSTTVQKVAKGKYGKDKAPMPPNENDSVEKLEIKTEISESESSVPKKEDVIVDNVIDLPKVEVKETEGASAMDLKTDNLLESDKSLITGETEPELELASKSKLNLDYNDRARHKSKSPVPKAILTFGKILQIPNKLAFWHKTDKDNVSDGSDASRKSSIESIKDEFQSCYDINNIASDNENKTNLNKTLNGNKSNEIIEKNDELKKVTEAKIETNPEYKFIPLCGEISTSKSTDV